MDMRLMKMLALLAEQTGEKVSENRLEFTYKKLEPLGVNAICAALEKLMETCRRFPTVGEVKAAMGIADATPESKAREVAELIWSGISRFSSINGRDLGKMLAIDEYLGPIGAEVVKMAGGWNHICDTATNDHMTTLKAQWREYAKVIAERGPDRAAPDFERLPQRCDESLRQLAAKFSL